MPVKNAIKTANVCANIYEGEFMLNFDCVGVEKCRHALCPIMPPDGQEECAYCEHGSCRRTLAQIAALELLRTKINGELKRHKNEEG